tara:strand:- start:180 stop:662 length:483 start_codon:yes stop_codon:yes gene_type:complete
MTGDVEFCDNTNTNPGRRRLLRAVVPIGDEIASRRLGTEKHILEPVKADKAVTADTMAMLSFSDDKAVTPTESEHRENLEEIKKSNATISTNSLIVVVILGFMLGLGIFGAVFRRSTLADKSSESGSKWSKMAVRPMSVDSVVNKNAETRRVLGMGAFRL